MVGLPPKFEQKFVKMRYEQLLRRQPILLMDTQKINIFVVIQKKKAFHNIFIFNIKLNSKKMETISGKDEKKGVCFFFFFAYSHILLKKILIMKLRMKRHYKKITQ